MMEIRPHPTVLPKDVLRQEVRAMQDRLERWGVREIVAFHGGVTDVDEALQWTPIQVAVSTLVEFVDKVSSQSGFRLGDDDLFFETIDRRVTFQLCHEGDVHFQSDDSEQLLEVRQAWRKLGLSVYQVGDPS